MLTNSYKPIYIGNCIRNFSVINGTLDIFGEENFFKTYIVCRKRIKLNNTTNV